MSIQSYEKVRFNFVDDVMPLDGKLHDVKNNRFTTS